MDGCTLHFPTVDVALISNPGPSNSPLMPQCPHFDSKNPEVVLRYLQAFNRVLVGHGAALQQQLCRRHVVVGHCEKERRLPLVAVAASDPGVEHVVGVVARLQQNLGQNQNQNLEPEGPRTAHLEAPRVSSCSSGVQWAHPTLADLCLAGDPDQQLQSPEDTECRGRVTGDTPGNWASVRRALTAGVLCALPGGPAGVPCFWPRWRLHRTPAAG